MAKYQQYEEYKDSGVEWLGQVPSEWSVSPLKLYLNTRKGVAFKSADFTDIGIRVVKASDIKDKTIRQSEVFLPSSFSEIYPKSVLKEGEIIISTVGSTPDVKNSAVGQIGILPFELDGSLLNQNTVVLSPKNNVLSNLFLFYLIQTDVYREHLDLNAHGTANQALFEHVVIDEAQDFSPFQVCVLQKYARNVSFTILGDLLQNIHHHLLLSTVSFPSTNSCFNKDKEVFRNNSALDNISRNSMNYSDFLRFPALGDLVRCLSCPSVDCGPPVKALNCWNASVPCFLRGLLDRRTRQKGK